MGAENRLWGQKRIEAELARWGFIVSARTVAKYMGRHNRGPSPVWREFLKRHEPNVRTCDFFCVRTIWFQTLYVFFVVRHINREMLHVAVTPCPTAEWTPQQIIECCAWDRWPPRFLIHDRDSRYGAIFARRLRHLGIEQVRTPQDISPASFSAPLRMQTIDMPLTDLGGAYSLTLDKHAGVVKFVLAYDVLSTRPNWDNLRLLDSEVLGEHPLDRLRMRLRHYRSSLRHRSLPTLKRSR
jgi:hypothetical protein